MREPRKMRNTRNLYASEVMVPPGRFSVRTAAGYSEKDNIYVYFRTLGQLLPQGIFSRFAIHLICHARHSPSVFRVFRGVEVLKSKAATTEGTEYTEIINNVI